MLGLTIKIINFGCWSLSFALIFETVRIKSNLLENSEQEFVKGIQGITAYKIRLKIKTSSLSVLVPLDPFSPFLSWNHNSLAKSVCKKLPKIAYGTPSKWDILGYGPILTTYMSNFDPLYLENSKNYTNCVGTINKKRSLFES